MNGGSKFEAQGPRYDNCNGTFLPVMCCDLGDNEITRLHIYNFFVHIRPAPVWVVCFHIVCRFWKTYAALNEKHFSRSHSKFICETQINVTQINGHHKCLKQNLCLSHWKCQLAREKFDAAGWELAEPSGEDALPDDTMSKEAVKKIVHRRFRILAVCQHNAYMNTWDQEQVISGGK